MSETIMKRSEVNVEDTWKLEDFYETTEDFFAEMEQVKNEIPEFSKYQTNLTDSAKILLEYLKKKSVIGQKIGKLYVYSNQKYHEDTQVSFSQQISESASNVMNAFYQAISFEEAKLLNLSEEILAQYYQDEPELLHYRRYLEEVLRNKEHILSEEMEELLAGVKELADVPSNIFSMFDNADLKFPQITDSEGKEYPLSHGTYMVYLKSKDRTLREHAFMTLYHTYESYQNTLAATYNGNLKQACFMAKERKFSSSREMALFDAQIPLSVYDNLIHAVHENMDYIYKYMKLRKKLLGVSELHFYDLYVPMVSSANEEISFEQAKETVKKALSVMGEEYLSVLQEGYDHRWIDVYENEGKRSGAYSWGSYGVHPYVLLNHKNDLNSMFTLAHEMGHAIHSYYSNQNQSYEDADYKIFVAEVASTVNESLLMQYLLHEVSKEIAEKEAGLRELQQVDANGADKEPTEADVLMGELKALKEKKAGYLNYYLEQFRTTLYRQTMFAEFEKITHELCEKKEPLNAERFKEIYLDLNRRYFGADVELDPEISMEWARIPHFYTPFYVYQYATGYSAAIALSFQILKEGKPAADRYIKNFLCGGCSKSPIELLKGAGVDMSTDTPIKEALQVFGELLEEMNALVSE